jgi:predicted ATP-dependent endonuclease of OLD family
VLLDLEISGLRGFATTQRIRFAVPRGIAGSGLTTIVGANNAGKSTIIEALRAVSLNGNVSFTRGKRNAAAGDEISISLQDESGAQIVWVRSVTPGSSETVRDQSATPEIFVVPSRRTFNPHFGKNDVDRVTYSNQVGLPSNRTSAVDHFSGRLFRANTKRTEFNAVLQKLLDPPPEWTIDQEDSGQYFIKISTASATHSSEGMGEGLVSLLFIVDALYDSSAGSMIAIDEPELSLHPALQRRLSNLLLEYAADRQIVIATHSPYFANPTSLLSGGELVRVHLWEQGSQVAQLSQESRVALRKLTGDTHNPHILGLDAREVFFLEDGIVLVEGQEDVIYLERALKSIGIDLPGHFFGWGVGGAEKMGFIATILRDLGYKRVVGTTLPLSQ